MKRKVLLLSCALLCAIIAHSGVVWTSFPGTAHEGDVITLKGKYVDSSGTSYPIRASISEWSGAATFSKIGDGQYKLVHVGSSGMAQVYWVASDNGRFLSDGWYQFDFKLGTGGSGGGMKYHGPWYAELDGPDVCTNDVFEVAVKKETIHSWDLDDELTMSGYIAEWRVKPTDAGVITANGVKAVFRPSASFDRGSFSIEYVLGRGRDGVIWDDWTELIVSKTIYYKCAPPEFSVANNLPYAIYVKPADGIKVYCKTPNVTIRYTTNGAEPTENSPLYRGPLDIGSDCTLKAKAWRSGFLPSEVATIQLFPRDCAIAPIIVETNLVADVDTDNMYWNIALSTVTEGAKIYYTLDKTNPHGTNATLYTGPFQVYSNLLLRAVASLPNSIESVLDFEIPYPVSLGEAMDIPGWEFFSSSTEFGGDWKQTRENILVGESFAACSSLKGNGMSELRMPVKGRGRLKFIWRIVEGAGGTANCNSTFSFYDGDVLVGERSTEYAGSLNWSSYSYESKNEFERTFRWVFKRNSSTAFSTAYLDKISWDSYSPWRMSLSNDHLTVYEGKTCCLPNATGTFAYQDGSKPEKGEVDVMWRIVSGGEYVALENGYVRALKAGGMAVLEAVYEEPGNRHLAAQCFVETVPEVVYLQIAGPHEVLSGNRYAYSCFAMCSDGSRKRVDPEWYFVPGASTQGVSADLGYRYRHDGVLMIDSASKSGKVALRAAYAEEGDFAVTTEVAIVENTLTAAVSKEPAPVYTFISTSGSPWYVVEEDIAREKCVVVQSGAISPGAKAELETSIDGPGQISFWWRVSAQEGCGALSFLVDGEERLSISGSDKGWLKVDETLGVGTHKLTWRYAKSAVSEGCFDCGWVDDFCFTPVEGRLVIEGPDDLFGGMTGEYSCKIVYANGEEQIVQPTWSFTSTDSNIKFKSSTGVLTTVKTNANVVLTATYKTDWLDLSTEKAITVVYRTMDALTVDGPSELVAGESSACVCTVTYSDGTTRQVCPDDSDWSVTYSLGDEVRDGVLITVPYYHDRIIELWGRWRENGAFKSSRKSILVKGVKTATCSVEDAIGWSNVVYTTGGDVPWIGQTLASHDGISAAQSGEVREGQSSSLTLSVFGPGLLSYYWKAEGRYGTLTCNGNICDTSETIGGHGPTQNWHFVSTSLTSLETNSVTWVYKATKDSALHGCAWIDEVQWEPYKFTELSISSTLATLGTGKTLRLYCYLNYEGGFKMSRNPEWSIISGDDCASIDSTGRLTAKMKSGVVRVMAKMTVDGKERSCFYDVQVVSSLASLEILGPENACGGETVSYSCFAHYDTGEIKAVAPTWTIVTNATGSSYSRQAETLVFDVPVNGGEITVHATYSEKGTTKTADKALSVEPAPHKPVEIEILGEQEMPYDKSISLECRVTYADRSVVSVTPSWRVVSGNATIDEAGNLHAETAGLFEIEATYGENGAIVIDAKKVRLVRVLNAVRIEGPAIVKYSRPTIISCVAEYNDGTSATIAPVWSLDDKSSLISDNGELVAGTTGLLTINATYEEGGAVCTSTKCLTVYREVVELKVMETTVKFGGEIQLQCVAVRLGGAEEVVRATWSLESGGDLVTLDEQGCLTAIGRGGGEVWVRATYEEFGDVKSVRMRVIVQPADSIALVVCSLADTKGIDKLAVTSVVVKASIGEVPAYLFQYWSNVVSVVVEEGVTSVGDGAFRDMAALREVDLPGSVGRIGSRTFSQDKALERVRLGWGITSIGGGAFLNCEGMKELYMPSSVTNVYSGAFGWCIRLQMVTFEGNAPTLEQPDVYFGTPDTLTTYVKPWSTGWSVAGSTALPEKWPVGDSAARKIAWYDPEMIALEIGKVSDTNGVDLACVTSVVVKAELGTIPKQMFSGWAHLRTLRIEEGVTRICSSIQDCPELEVIEIPLTVTKIDAFAFSACGKLRRADLPDGIGQIESGTFANCTNLESTVIPDSVKWIGDYAYIACTNLRELAVGAGVTNVGKHAINGCTSLTNVIIKGTVTTFNNAVFQGCASLTKVTFLKDAPQTVGDNIYSLTPSTLTTYVSYGSTGWSEPGSTELPAKWPVGISSAHAIAWFDAPEKLPELEVVASGWSGTYDGDGHGVTVDVKTEGVTPTIRYSTSADGPFVETAPVVRNVWESGDIWYEVSAPGYASSTGSVKVVVDKLTDAPYRDWQWFNVDSFDEGLSNDEGDWNVPSDGRVTVSDDGSALVLEAESDPIFFEPRKKALDDLIDEVHVRIEVSSYSRSLLPAAVDGMIASILFVREPDDKTIGCVVWTKDGWLDVSASGVTPHDGDVVDVVMTVDYATDPALVSYMINSNVLADASGGVRFPVLGSKRRVSTVGFSGTCTIEKMMGTLTDPSRVCAVADGNGVWTYYTTLEEAQAAAGGREIVMLGDVSDGVYVSEAGITVPASWLEKYPAILTAVGGDRTKAVRSVGANGKIVWECYVADLDPTNPESKFRAFIAVENGEPKVTWDPDLGSDKRTYRTFGAKSLGTEPKWDDLTGKSKEGYNFFKVTVELPK